MATITAQQSRFPTLCGRFPCRGETLGAAWNYSLDTVCGGIPLACVGGTEMIWRRDILM